MRWAKLYEDFVRDQRLTLRDFRVYSALSLFADKEGNCHPKREHLVEITGLRLTRISEVTSRLVQLGWVEKVGDGGKSKSSHYRLLASPFSSSFAQTVPDLGTQTVPDLGTVTATQTVPDLGQINAQTVPDLGTQTVPDLGTVTATQTVPDLGQINAQTVPDLGTQTVPDLGTGKEQPIKQPKLKDNSPIKKGASAAFCAGADADPVAIASPPKASKPAKAPLALPPAPDWLPATTWQAFIDHRIELKKPLTVHAAQITLNHLDQARGFGHAPVVLIEAAIASGWTGCVFERHLHAPQPSARSVKSHVVAPPKTNPDAYKPTGRFASAVEMTA